ncbi:MAG: histidine--tRNA ligase [Crocinitomicaceae bacterium]|jgi:histidyl-tRNA synthetase|nr:histidine--tRNA ligase [Crocinitomicaceae bacterium]
MSKPSIPKGTRDFGPVIMARRNWMFSIMRRSFERYGFQPIETPAMESLSTLTGKYGDEGDQLIFKLLNNGDFMAKANSNALDSKDSKALLPSISKKALRYDLTVPFARFVVMSRNDLAFPFRRYQMQTVWRGDRPGKGRYQEFTQCDADIIGSESILCELDLMQLFNEVLSGLGVPGYQIMVNDRRLLNGLARSWGIESQFSDLTVALDKWDKIGEDGVRKELHERGMSSEQIENVMSIFDLLDSQDVFARLKGVQALLLPEDEEAQNAHNEVLKLLEMAIDSGVPISCISFDPTLARGLNYYTGAIFEVRVKDAPVGSICGGGRYANLTGIFGWEGMSGVGISFGADRIYDVLEHFQAFPVESSTGPQVLVLMLDHDAEAGVLKMTSALRNKGIRASAYPSVAKLKKQMKYAADLGVNFVVMAGEEERLQKEWTVRHMETGQQQQLSEAAVLDLIRTTL